MAVLGLDIGGTKVAAALVDVDGGVLRAARRPTSRTDVWKACAAVLREVADGVHVRAVGIASAGPIDEGAGTVSPLNISSWRDFPVVEAVREEFAGAHVVLGGDGPCVALAEHRFGAGRGTPDLLGVVVSTGVGGGLLLAGRVVGGRTGNAGHIGHVVVEPNGAACACGGQGCLEAVASGPSSVRWARARGWGGLDGIALADDAHNGVEVAVAALARAGAGLGQAFASTAALVDVDLVVLGGGFAAAGDPLWRPMREAVAKHAGLSFTRGLRVVPPELGSDAGLVGAAALVF
ncbi:MAG: ROK family protein [Mycobacteriaceae bacterium]